MDVIVTGRQGGKTTRLIREAAEQFAYHCLLDDVLGRLASFWSDHPDYPEAGR